MFRRFIKGLSLKTRIRLILEVGVLFIAIYTVVLGHPPAKAQRTHPVPMQQVITDADEKRDLAIDKLQTFQKNQENWNHETGVELQQHDAAINRFWGGLAAIMFAITALIGVTVKFGNK